MSMYCRQKGAMALATDPERIAKDKAELKDAYAQSGAHGYFRKQLDWNLLEVKQARSTRLNGSKKLTKSGPGPSVSLK